MNFFKHGINFCGNVFATKDCKRLLKKIYLSRNFKNLFLTKKVWQSGKFKLIKNNPGPGRNLLHKLDTQFIFDNKKFSKYMCQVLGKNYRILDAKLVMGVPRHLIPKWILDLKKDSHTINLGGFIKPKYRDITYFRGIDFHQDIIDYPTREPDFVTAYIYLEKVDENSAPLFVIPHSHLLGASTFPHNIKKVSKKNIKYTANKKKLVSYYKVLTGKPGSMFFWHPFMLHGTQPYKKDKARISVRILVEKNRRTLINCDLDKVNKKISGKHKLNFYNKEENKKGVGKKRNFINKL